jgi:hypothetical protein
MVPGAPEALYRAEKSYGAKPVSGFVDTSGFRDDIVAYPDKCYSSRCLPRSGRLETQVSHLLVLNSLYGRVGNL